MSKSDPKDYEPRSPKFPAELKAPGYFAEKLARDRHQAQFVFMAKGEAIVSSEDPGNIEKWIVKGSGRVTHYVPSDS